MPIGLSSVVGRGGHRRHFFGFCIRNSMPNLPFAGSRSNTYGEPTAAWIHAPSPMPCAMSIRFCSWKNVS